LIALLFTLSETRSSSSNQGGELMKNRTVCILMRKKERESEGEREREKRE